MERIKEKVLEMSSMDSLVAGRKYNMKNMKHKIKKKIIINKLFHAKYIILKSTFLFVTMACQVPIDDEPPQLTGFTIVKRIKSFHKPNKLFVLDLEKRFEFSTDLPPAPGNFTKTGH